MFQKFHTMREEREGGFTLIELLVVILIIAILAAIAIPVFLNQRRKGWRSQTESAVKNAATAEESWLTSNPSYTSVVADLQSEGFTFSATAVSVEISTTAGTGYCIHAESDNDSTIDSWYHSADGRPTTAAPTATNPTCPTTADIAN